MVFSHWCKSNRPCDRGEPTDSRLLGDHSGIGDVTVLAHVRHVCTASAGQESRFLGPHNLPPRRGSHLARKDPLPRLLYRVPARQSARLLAAGPLQFEQSRLHGVVRNRVGPGRGTGPYGTGSQAILGAMGLLVPAATFTAAAIPFYNLMLARYDAGVALTLAVSTLCVALGGATRSSPTSHSASVPPAARPGLSSSTTPTSWLCATPGRICSSRAISCWCFFRSCCSFCATRPRMSVRLEPCARRAPALHRSHGRPSAASNPDYGHLRRTSIRRAPSMLVDFCLR